MKNYSKIIVLIILICVSTQFSSAQISNRVKTGVNLTTRMDLTKQTPVLTATRDDIAKALPSKKLRKKINRKTTSEFADKIPDDYRPKSGKLNVVLHPQKPFTSRAYIDFPRGKFQPMQRRIGLSGDGSDYGGDLYIKFKAKSGKRYLVRLKMNTADNTNRRMESFEEPIMYCYMGDIQTTFPLEKSFGVLTNKEYEFEIIVQATTSSWIQIPFGSSMISTDSRHRTFLNVPWSFVSAVVSEL